jgi:hypothetical protein
VFSNNARHQIEIGERRVIAPRPSLQVAAVVETYIANADMRAVASDLTGAGLVIARLKGSEAPSYAPARNQTSPARA